MWLGEEMARAYLLRLRTVAGGRTAVVVASGMVGTHVILEGPAVEHPLQAEVQVRVPGMAPARSLMSTRSQPFLPALQRRLRLPAECSPACRHLRARLPPSRNV